MNRNLIVSLALIVAVLAVYGQVIRFDFVYFDDPDYVLLNTHIHDGPSINAVAWAFTTGWAANWHPVTWLSHMLDCQLFGLNPAGHHLTNLLLHAVNSLLLFKVLTDMTGRWMPSTLVAALFALHPMHVESVAWVSERKDLLSAGFGFAAILFYVRYTRANQSAAVLRHYLLMLACYALSLMAKPMLVTLPALLLLIDYWPLRRVDLYPRSSLSNAHWTANKHLLAEKAPVLVLAVASCVITLLVQHAGDAMRAADHVGFIDRSANAIVAYARYLIKTLCPTNLAAHYPHPNLPGGEPWSVGVILLSAVLIGGCTLVAIHWRRMRYLAVGWFWYVGTLVPVIGLVQVGEAAYSDRYTYMPSVGLFIIFAFGGAALVTHLKTKQMLPRAAHAVIAVGLAASIFALSCMTWSYAGKWRDSVTLFTHSLAVSPNSAVLHNNFGIVLKEYGETDRAIHHYEQAIKLHPRYNLAHHNLGNVHFIAGRLKQAEHHYTQSLNCDPDYAPSHISLGSVLETQGRFNPAIAQYKQALALKPNFAPLQTMLAAALARSGQIDESLHYFRLALAHTPDFVVTLNDVAQEKLKNVPIDATAARDALQLANAAKQMTHLRAEDIERTINMAKSALADIERTAQAPETAAP